MEGLTEPSPADRVRHELSGVDKPEDPQRPESISGVERVREERQRRLEAEPGYKMGKALGQQIRRSSLLVLPIEMALAPVLAALGGWWLDRRMETSPWFTLIGLLCGLTVAIRAVVRAIKEVSR